MRAADVIDAMETLAPLRYAAGWDRVGLHVGSRDAETTGVLLTIDLTRPVLDEALDAGVSTVIAYHPPIFEPLPALTDATPRGALLLDAARNGLCVYTPHTALDAAPGGINDWLAAGLGDGDSAPIETHATLPATETHKIVTFCPAEAATPVRAALAAAGAGRIGAYTSCSFEIPGTGTFHGGVGTSPAVGAAGRLERVDEVRLEMVCGAEALDAAVSALRSAHPYEEPPIEIYALQKRPDARAGQGRRVELTQPATLDELVGRIKRRLGVEGVRVARGADAPDEHRVIALCPGAGGALLPGTACDLFLTGEMRHHDVLAAQAGGTTVVLAGHTNTERPYLDVLRARLAERLPGSRVLVADSDKCPWTPA